MVAPRMAAASDANHPPPASPAAQVPQLRALVQDCIAKHLYSTAVFFADKLVSLTDYGASDVFLLAQVGGGGVGWCLFCFVCVSCERRCRSCGARLPFCLRSPSSL